MEKIRKNGYLFVWGVFFIYLLLQHNLIWMHIDDYGYASLNYVVSVGTSGNNYTIADIFRYLYAHYTQWGGRILYYGIAILVYHFGGLIGMRIFQSFIIFAIFFFLFYIPSRNLENNYKAILSVLVCLLYGVFQIGLANYSLYWFSASSGYVWPILSVFLASYILYKLIESESNKLYKWFICSIAWFISSFSQEQIAIASLIICIMLVLYGKFIKRNEHILYSLFPLFMTFLGAAIMLLTPGNFGRLEATSNKMGMMQMRLIK